MLWKVRLALIEIAGNQIDRQHAAPFQIHQQRQQPVGILAARQCHQPAWTHRCLGFRRRRHGKILNRLPHIADQPLAQLVERNARRRTRIERRSRPCRRLHRLHTVDHITHGTRDDGFDKISQAPNTDHSIRLANCSSAAVPSLELPTWSSPGDQTAIEAKMPPPTPDLPGRPTR